MVWVVSKDLSGCTSTCNPARPVCKNWSWTPAGLAFLTQTKTGKLARPTHNLQNNNKAYRILLSRRSSPSSSHLFVDFMNVWAASTRAWSTSIRCICSLALTDRTCSYLRCCSWTPKSCCRSKGALTVMLMANFLVSSSICGRRDWFADHQLWFPTAGARFDSDDGALASDSSFFLASSFSQLRPREGNVERVDFLHPAVFTWISSTPSSRSWSALYLVRS